MTAADRTRGIVSWLLIALGGLVLFAGITFLYLRQEVLSPDSFADRATHSLDDPAVRDYLAAQLTERVVEGADARTIAARPLIETAIAGVVGSSIFRPIVHGAAAQLYGAAATKTGGKVALGLTDGVVLAIQALRAQSGVRLDVPAGLEGTAIKLGERENSRRIIHNADRARTAGLVLPPIGVALLIAGVLVAARRRRAIAGSGAALALAGVLIAVALPIGRVLVERGYPDDDRQSAAAGGLYDAMLGDLRYWAIGAVAVGLALWLTAANVLRRVPLPVLAKRTWEWAMRAPRGRLEAVGRGLLLILVAIAMIVAWQSVLLLAVLAVAVALAVQGLGLVLGVIAPAAMAAGAGEGPAVAMPQVHVRRRSAVLAAGVLTALFIAGGVALGVRGPASYGSADVTACNGHAELCDRPVNEVAFAATHNSMSAADQPAWFRAEHRFGIPRQLRYGIRGFLIDSWYGIPNGSLVASDFQRAPDDSAVRQAFADLQPSALDAFRRLRSRFGFKNAGASRPFLCHVFCEAGSTDLVKGLTWFRQFLDRNPGEVIILDIEDYVAPNDLRLAFASSGLLPYVYRHVPGSGWPTLGQLIEDGTRAIVMTEHHNGGIPWILPAYHGYLEETPYKFTLDQIANPLVSCKPNRGGTDRPFFLLNNWIESSVPDPGAAQKVNNYDALISRALSCERDRHHIPNMVAVDFYRAGDVIGVVNTLNGLPKDAEPTPN